MDTQQHSGDLDVTAATFALDTSYPTGGSAVTWANLGLNRVLWAHVAITNETAATVENCYYDPVNQVLKCFVAGAEVTNGTNLSAIVVRVVAYGYAR